MTDLDTIDIRVYDADTSFVKSTSGAIGTNEQTFSLSGFGISGLYTARVAISNPNHSFVYNKYLSFVVSPEGGTGEEGTGDIVTDVPAMIESSIQGLGMANTIGYAIITLIVMAVVFWFSRRHRQMRIVFPLMVLAISMIMGWIPIWVIVLLAVVFGFILWRSIVGRSKEA